MPGFVGGLPAQGSPLVSAEVRDNFLALNARTDKLTPRATVPASSRVTIGEGTIYFTDQIQVSFEGQQLDLGSESTGVTEFNNIGFFKDIVIVLRVSFNSSTSRYEADAVFLEGPEKASATAQPSLVQTTSTDIPVAAFTVRHNGLNLGILKGQIEPIRQNDILDIRNYVNTGGLSYYSATVGDRQVQEDGYGAVILDEVGDGYQPRITGETIGSFTGVVDDGYGNLIHPIQQAVDYVSDAGGGVVFLRRGTYTPFDTITIPDNVQLLGEGANTVLIREDTFSGPLLQAKGNNIGIDNIYIQGPSTHTFAFGPLVQFSASKYGSVKNCFIDATDVTGISFEDVSARCICSNNFITNADTAVFISNDSTKMIVSLNQFENNDTEISGSGGHYKMGNLS